MKKVIYLLVSITITFIFTSCKSNNNEIVGIQDMGTPKIQYLTNEPEYPDDVIGRIDYPLIEIYFNRNDVNLVILYENIFTSNKQVKILLDSDAMENIKGNFHVLTFPAGRGTTPDSIIYVYKNGELIKYVEFFNAVDYDVSMFELSSLEELQEVYGIEGMPVI